MRATAELITDDQIRWLRKRTGWKGRAAEDQQVIATALSTPQDSIPNIFDDLFPNK